MYVFFSKLFRKIYLITSLLNLLAILAYVQSVCVFHFETVVTIFLVNKKIELFAFLQRVFVVA